MTQPNEPNHAILQLIDERDDARMAADQLAAAVARLAGVDIGEPTDTNDPWQNALDALDRLNGATQAADRAELLRKEMEARWSMPAVEPGRVLVPPRIYEDIKNRWPIGTEPDPAPAPAKKCTCDVPDEPQFPHRPWCDLMHDCTGASCTVCSPPDALVNEFPNELGNPGRCGEGVPQAAMATTPESGEQ